MNTSLIRSAVVVLAAVTIFPLRADAQQTGPSDPGALVLNSTTGYRDVAVAHHGERRRGHWHPPSKGRYIRGHWTPWDPPDPALYPADGVKHQIVKGDTLWDISGHYYQDPLLWPFLWEANDWILDPEWIYPGDVLFVPALSILPPGSPRSQVAMGFPRLNKGFRKAASYSDQYCGHFVRSPNQAAFGEIIETEADPTWVTSSLNDVVYINVGRKDGVLPGDEFAITYPRQHLGVTVDHRERRREELIHPVTSQHMGYVTKMAGRLRVILLGEEVSTAQIVYACDAIELGFDLYPFSEVPVPLVRRHDMKRHVLDIADRGRGFVAWVEGDYAAGITGSLVTIDLGADDGLLPGDVLTVFRNSETDIADFDTDFFGKFFDRREGLKRVRRKRTDDERGVYFDQRAIERTPPRIIAELVVLYSEPHTSTARVNMARQEVVPGDRIAYAGADRELITVRK